MKLSLLTFAVGCDRDNEPKGCGCPLNYSPVCASDGKTHSNACFAQCEGLSLENEGACNFTLEGEGAACASEGDCKLGQQCIGYTGVNGDSLASCYVDCALPGEAGGGTAICPANLQCVSVADGPDSVCIDVAIQPL
jgi:hypothetical protein